MSIMITAGNPRTEHRRCVSISISLHQQGHRDWRYVCTVRQSHHVTLGYSSPQYGWDHMYDEEAALYYEQFIASFVSLILA